MQLEAYERARSSSSSAHKRSKSNAIARLSSLNQKASELKSSPRGPPAEGGAEPQRPETRSHEQLEGEAWILSPEAVANGHTGQMLRQVF